MIVDNWIHIRNERIFEYKNNFTPGIYHRERKGKGEHMGNERNSDKASCWPRAYIEARTSFRGHCCKASFQGWVDEGDLAGTGRREALGKHFAGIESFGGDSSHTLFATEFSNRIIFHLALNLTGTFRAFNQFHSKNISK